MTLYPTTKCTPERAADIIEMVGTERIMANSAGDWGKSEPLAVPELILEMRRRGHREAMIRKVVYENPLAFWRQAAAGGTGPIRSSRRCSLGPQVLQRSQAGRRDAVARRRLAACSTGVRPVFCSSQP